MPSRTDSGEKTSKRRLVGKTQDQWRHSWYSQQSGRTDKTLYEALDPVLHMKTMRVVVETAEIATEMIGGANASIVTTMMTIQASSGQALRSHGTTAIRLTDDPMITVTVETIIQMTVVIIETIAQMIAATADIAMETTDATTAIATRGQNGVGEQTKNLNTQSKKGWTIIADFICTKEMTVSYALTIR